KAVVASDGLAARRDGDDLEGLSPFTRRLREHLHRGDHFAGQESVEDHHADAQGLGREGDRAHEGQHTAEKSTHPNLSIRPFPRFCEEAVPPLSSTLVIGPTGRSIYAIFAIPFLRGKEGPVARARLAWAAAGRSPLPVAVRRDPS